ncbi:hypothetical protein J2X32_003780 [Rheinheimera pacifica]|uniref:hypothetical protein n=1 Tax=Rheinheimera pacifica TaxID=173990 RepID=UPI0028631061|nr:hypothetical protein [Rheinheimera pacifica]MDR6985123.1 hypothetical protein [Rheinheimera pacifica]
MRLLLILCSFFIAAFTVDASVWCSGKIKGVYITSGGDVVINGSWRNNWTRICNLNAGDVNTVTCSMWASYAATATKENIDVTLNYNNGVSSCSAIDTYENAPTPYYLMLNV